MKRREGHSPTPQEEIGAEPLRVPFFPFICQDKEWCCSSFEQTPLAWARPLPTLCLTRPSRPCAARLFWTEQCWRIQHARTCVAQPGVRRIGPRPELGLLARVDR